MIQQSISIIEETFDVQSRIMALFYFFGRKILLEAMVVEMDKKGYRPADSEDLQALAKSRPELQEKFSIIGLSGGSYLPCLDTNLGGERIFVSVPKVAFIDFSVSLSGRCRFAAVLK